MADNPEQLLAEIQQAATEISNFLGVDEARHGMQQGTVQAALVEAQNGSILRAGASGTGGASLQETAELAKRMEAGLAAAAKDAAPQFTRAQITGQFNHFDQMRSAANGIQNNLSEMEANLGKLNRVAPDAARIARQAYQPLMSAGGERVKLALDVESTIVEITNSGNANRLSGVVITETGRDVQFLAENQLKRQNLSLLPNAVNQGKALMQRIANLPVNSQQAREMLKDITAKGATGATAAYNAIRAAGATGRSMARIALESVGEFLAAFGSRLVMIPLVSTKALRKASGAYDPDDGA